MPKKKVPSEDYLTRKEFLEFKNTDFRDLKNELTNFRGEVALKLDKIIKELEIAREDRIFAIAKDREQDQKIENLDVRVKVLEKIRA